MTVRTLTIAAAVFALALAGCTAAPSAPLDPDPDPVAESPEPDVAPPASLTWESSCLLSVDEVATIMQGYDWLPADPVAMVPGSDDTGCDYGETDPDSIRHVAIDFRAYDPVASYGWVSPTFDHPGFTAPDAVTGAQNACATATAAPGSAGLSGICTTVGSVPVVVDPNRLSVVVFPPGDAFYIIQLYGISGGAAETDPLLALATLAADRPLVAR